MFSHSVRFISRHFSRSIKRYSFTRVSYTLSIMAFVLATFAICMVTTVMYSLQQFQKQRLLGYTPHVIVTLHNPIANIYTGVSKARVEQFITSLRQHPKLIRQIQEIRLYTGGEYFLQYHNNLLEGNIVGVSSNTLANYTVPTNNFIDRSIQDLKNLDHSSNQDSSITNKLSFSSNTNNSINSSTNSTFTSLLTHVPAIINSKILQPGSYSIILPQPLTLDYNFKIGDKVTLINSQKSTYYPTGPLPVTRTFTIAGFYPTRNKDNVWYVNLYDGARVNLQANINQVAIFLKNPLNVTTFITELSKDYQLTETTPYILTPTKNQNSGIINVKLAFNSQTDNSTASKKNNSKFQDNPTISDSVKNTSSIQSDHTQISPITPISPVTPTVLTPISPIPAPVTTNLTNNKSPSDSSTGFFNFSNLNTYNKITEVTDWRTKLAVLFKSIQFEARTTDTLTSLLIIIAILSCLITFSFLIVEKDRDVAILNVLGMNPKQINHIFIWVSIGLLIRANIISMIFVAIAIWLWPYYNHLLNLYIDLQVNWFECGLIYIGCTLIVLLAVALTGKFIIKIRPSQVLR